MLEIRYNKTTKRISGWWGNRHGNNEIKLANRPNEAMTVIDTDIPTGSLDAYLYDQNSASLIPNPDYTGS